MTRTLKLALVVSLAVHAAAFAVLRIVSIGESKRSVENESHIVVLVPVQEDFIAKPVEASLPPALAPPSPIVEPRPEAPAPKPEPPPLASTVPTLPPPKSPESEAKVVPSPSEKVSESLPQKITNEIVSRIEVKTSIAATAVSRSVEPVVTMTNTLPRPALITGRVKYRSAQDPDYPPLARRRRQEGTVLLDVTISPSGRAMSVSVKQSSSYPLLDRAAVEAVESWRFEVETTVPVRAEIPVRFQLVK